jgi:hypothetical protein
MVAGVWSTSFSLLGVLLLALRFADAAEPPALPSAGLVDLDEFTVEMWVKLAFDPQAHHEAQRIRGFTYELHYGDPVNPHDGVHAFMFSEFHPTHKKMVTQTYNQVFANGDRLLYSLLAAVPDAKANSWHHFAVSFRGRKRWIHVNGEGGESELSGSFAHKLRSTAVLRLGTDWCKGPCELAFDEVRVSNIARARDQLGFFAKEPLQPDRYTTLLLNFDEAERSPDGKTIKPIFASTPSVAAGVPKPTESRWIEGKFGKTLLVAPSTKE